MVERVADPNNQFDPVCGDGVFCNGAETSDLFAGRISGTPPCPNPEYSSEEIESCLAPVDFDRDGDVDQFDHDEFESYASGPAGPYVGDCSKADFDGDYDVDQVDFGIFQRRYSGENNPADAGWAD